MYLLIYNKSGLEKIVFSQRVFSQLSHSNHVVSFATFPLSNSNGTNFTSIILVYVLVKPHHHQSIKWCANRPGVVLDISRVTHTSVHYALHADV